MMSKTDPSTVKLSQDDILRRTPLQVSYQPTGHPGLPPSPRVGRGDAEYEVGVGAGVFGLAGVAAGGSEVDGALRALGDGANPAVLLGPPALDRGDFFPVGGFHALDVGGQQTG